MTSKANLAIIGRLQNNLLRPLYFLAIIILLGCSKVAAHGGVTIEEDLCVIKFGFYRAHFAVYQTETSGDEEFCEDLPDSGKTIFVLNYMHNSLKEVPVDFRIITDFTGLGRFAKWQDIEKIDDLSQYTVHYQAPTIESQGSLTTQHAFLKAGNYIGIVTAKHPSKEKIYRAVFPFQVGSSGLGYVLFFAFVFLIVVVQIRFRTISYMIAWLRVQLAKSTN